MIYITKEDRQREALAQEGAQALATIAGWETEPCPVLLPPALAGYPSERGGIVSVDIAADGSQILRWMKTPTFQMVVGVFIALAIIGTIVSAVLLVRKTRSSRRTSNAVA